LGDARQTDAGQKRGEWNVGQLMRERFGLSKTFNIGFNTYHGTVTAAKSWDKPANHMIVKNGLLDSYEHIFHAATEDWEHKNYYMLFRSNAATTGGKSNGPKIDLDLLNCLHKPRLERYIGVIYRPDSERGSHYSRSTIIKEFDALIYLDQTRALEPLDVTKPWLEQYEKVKQVQYLLGHDVQPEIDSATVICDERNEKDDLLPWRLHVGKQVQQTGLAFMKAQDYHSAITFFDKALQYVEYNIRRRPAVDVGQQRLRLQIMVDRGDAYFNLKLWSGVIRDCTTILSLDPSHYQAHLLLARAYDEKGQESIAKYHYESAARYAAQEWKEEEEEVSEPMLTTPTSSSMYKPTTTTTTPTSTPYQPTQDRR
jgi:tetratricopeptide (TPR) repeat protein